MKTVKLLISTILLLVVSHSFAQQITEVTQSGFVWPCGTFNRTIEVYADPGSPMNNGVITYAMPEGMTYLTGSLDSPEVSELNISDLQTPTFTLPSPLIGYFTFSISVSGDCSLVEDNTGLTDNLILEYDGGTDNFTTTPYNRNSPSPTIPDCSGIAEIANIGSTFERGCTVINPFETPIYELYLIDNFDTGVLTGTAIGGTLISENPFTVRFDSSDFSQIGNGNDIFEQNESIDLKFLIEVIDCGNGASQLSYAYGCNGEICEVFDVQQAQVVSESNVPNVIPTTTDFVIAAPCAPGYFQTSISNTGTELNSGAATAFDVVLNYGMNSSGSLIYVSDCITFSGFTLSGENVTATAQPAGGYFIDCQQFTSDPDGPGGLTDADGDGIFDDLPVGETTELYFDVTMNGCAAGGCPSDFDRQRIVSEFNYTAQCSDDIISEYNDYDKDYEYDISIVNPTNFFQNEDQNVTIFFDLFVEMNGFEGICPEGFAEFNFEVPEGLNLPSDFNPVFNNESVDFEVSGTQVTIDLPMENNIKLNDLLVFVLEGECEDVVDSGNGVCPPSPLYSYMLDYTIDFICSPDCEDNMPLMCSTTPAFEIVCPSTGGTNGSPTFVSSQRQSLGWTDITMTEKQDVNTPGLELQNALPGDTILFTTLGIMDGDDINFDALVFRLSHLMNNPDAAPYFTFLYGDVELRDAETSTSQTCMIELAGTLEQSSFSIDSFEVAPLNVVGGCLADYNLNSGDSIFFNAYYVLNPVVPTYLVSTTMTARILGANFCTNEETTLNVIQPELEFVHKTNYSGMGCDTIEIQTLTRIKNFEPNRDLFPFEHRPYMHYDSLIFHVPAWLEYVSGSGSYKYQERMNDMAVGALIDVETQVNDPEIIITDTENTIVFGNNPLLPIDYNQARSFSDFTFKTIPHCVNTARLDYLSEFYYQKNYYNPGNREEDYEEKERRSQYRALTMTLASDNPVYPGLTELAEWEFEYCYQGQSVDYTPNNWFLLDLPNSEIQPIVLTETLEDGSTIDFPILSIDGSEDHWVQIGNLYKNTCRYFKLSAEYTTCESTDFIVQSDFSCDGYPTDPTFDAYDCISDFPAMTLNLNPQAALLQISISDAPDAPVSLCEAIPYTLRIINGGLGGATTPVVSIGLPASGMYYVPGSSQLQVGQTGDMVNLADPIFDEVSQKYSWNLTEPVGLLPGVSLVPANQFLVHFSLTTDCDFNPQSIFTYRNNWLSLCEDTGATAELFSPPLNLQGAPTFFNQYDFSIDDSPGDACATESTLNVEMQYLGGGEGNVTSDFESIRMILPNSLNYLAESYNAGQNMPFDTEPSIMTEGDSTILIWQMPVGLAIGETISFDFGVETGAACQTVGLRGLINTSADIPCGSTPGGFCEIDFYGEETSGEISTERAEFTLGLENYQSFPAPPDGEMAYYDILLQNISDNSVSGEITLNIRTDDNGDGVFNPASDPLNHSFSVNISELENGGFITIPDSLLLNDTQICKGFFVLLNSTDNVCTCIDASAFYQPVLTGQNTAATACAAAELTLGNPAVTNYQYVWQPNEYISGTNQSQVDYFYTGDEDVFLDTLVLTITRPGGCFTLDTTFLSFAGFTTELTAQSADCHGESGSITALTDNNWDTYTVNWEHTDTDDQTQTNLPAGDYALTLTDAAGCMSESTITLTEPPLLSVALTGDNLTCFEDNSGSVDFSIAGGTGVYDLIWNEDITSGNLAAGTYTVTVTDENNCSVEEAISLTQPEPLTAVLTATELLCYGEATGTITSEVNGGTGTYDLTWNAGENGENLTAGTYTVTVSDANNCSVAETITLTEPTPLTVELTGTDLLCNEIASGAIEITTDGGTGTHELVWNEAVNGENLTAGTYTVTVSDANNCTVNQSITLTEPEPLVVELTGTNLSCYEDASGFISVNAAGGTGDYDLVWNEDSGNENLAAGIYTVTLSDANNCEVEQSITLTEPTPIVVELMGTDLICYEDTSGEITTNIDGGTGEYTLTWNEDISGGNLNAGIYALTVSDANNCFAQQSVTLSQPPPLAFTPMTENLNCNADNSGSIEITVQQGTNLLYSINNNTPQTQPTFENLPAGTYEITVMDAAGCSETQNQTLTEPSPLTALLTGTNLNCYNDNSGTITTETAGGTPPYHLNWNQNPVSNNLAAGTYMLTLTDANNCVTDTDITLTEPEEILLEAMGEDISCEGNNDGEIYVLHPENENFLYSTDGDNWQEELYFDNLTAGTYDVSVLTDEGCIGTQLIQLKQPSGTLLIAPPDTILTLGDSVFLQPYYNPDIVSVTWTPAAFLSCDTCFTAWSSPTQTVEYAITGTTLSGCEATDFVLIEVLNNVYAPNVFSPNDNGANDGFTIFTPNGLGNIDEMMIFDRWGEMVDRRHDFPPNIPALGWDGTLKGQDMNPAVFVWTAYVTLLSGEQIFIFGDVTLVR